MDDNKEKIIKVPIEDIIPNRFQPRLAFDEKELNDLANSIIKYGVIQPIVLRKIDDKYKIIAGERRYKASVLAGLKSIPSIIKNTDDNTSAEIALLENLQRKNLTVIEEAKSYRKLLDRGFTQEEIANKLGISQSSIANKLRLLVLPKKIQNCLLYNRISERHARSLLSLNSEEEQLKVLEKILDEKLTVKQTEDEISKIINGNQTKSYDEIKIDIPKIDETFNLNNVKQDKIEEKPQIVDIIDDIEEQIITPSKNLDEIFDDYSKKITPFNDEIIIDKPDIKFNDRVFKDNPKSINTRKVCNDIKSYVYNINEIKSSVNIKEVDLLDKYQIIIEIEKSTNE